MPTLLQQLALSYEAEAGNSSDGMDRAEPPNIQRDKLQQQQQELDQLQYQQLEQMHQQQREQQREREREREHLHQLQSISNLLLDLPPVSSGPYLPSHGRDASCIQSTRSSNGEGDMSISDLFGLGLPRGSLMGSQSAIGSPGYRHQQYHSQNHNQPSSQQHYQCEDGHGYYSSTSTLDTPGSPNSVTTPGSPSTPGSVYSNLYTYASAANNNSTQTITSPTNRMQLHQMGSPSSSNHSPYYGRPIRGSPPYSDCGSPILDYTPMLGCSGSRSNSPADSETSGVSSMDGSLSDIMNCLSMNSGSHPCYPQSLGAYLTGKHLASTQQQPQPSFHQHHSHAHARNHQYAQGQTGTFLNSLLTPEKNCCLGGNSHIMPVTSPTNHPEQQTSLDRAARFHRNAASLHDATCTWSGVLPHRTQKPLGYSSKVFLGGVPWDITESLLIATFKQFGQIRVEWPGKEQSATQPKGYVYIIFESEKQVKALLTCCTHDFTNGGSWYYKISSKRMKAKEVQVIPWVLNDSNYVKPSSQKLDPQKTVFVGALHGMLTAEGLAKIMNDLFEGVIYAGIDTDKWKYPIGSARVTFSSTRSYKKAVSAAFIEIKTEKFTKKVQVDPYLEDSLCSGCSVQQGPYFCRESVCFRYFCRSCWQWQHAMESMRFHKPMMRHSKTNKVVGLTPGAGMNSLCSRTPGSSKI